MSLSYYLAPSPAPMWVVCEATSPTWTIFVDMVLELFGSTSGPGAFKLSSPGALGPWSLYRVRWS
jgi:hypothetical protein